MFVSLCLYEISGDFGEFHPGAKGRKKEREGRKHRWTTDSDHGRLFPEISPRFTFCLRQGTHRCSLHFFVPGKRKFRLSLSCGPAPKPPKPTQNEAIHACPEKVCPTETVALGKAWVGDANLNLTRARKESLTHSTPPGCRIFCPEKRNLTQLLLLQSRLPRLKRTRSYYFQVCKCFFTFRR